jgi:hypothetical protein
MSSSISCGVRVEYCGSMVCYRHGASIQGEKKLVNKLPVVSLFVKK